jgi:hypothetical protein
MIGTVGQTKLESPFSAKFSADNIRLPYLSGANVSQEIKIRKYI